jgi:iron complex transport system substrate-binding protein
MSALSHAHTRRHWLLGTGACLAVPAWAQTTASGATGAQGTSSTSVARIVSVGGALTETLVALGARASLVGVDTTSVYPEFLRALPSVGYARALSAEGVLSLRPSLVVATQDAGPPAVLHQIEAARVPLVVLDTGHRFEGLMLCTEKLADLCGRADHKAALLAAWQRAWEDTRQAVAVHTRSAKAPPSVLFVLSHSMAQVRVAGRGTAADAMLRYAGAVNAMGDVQGYKPLTPEAAIAAAPDIILATEQGLQAAGGVDGLLKAPGLAQTPAGRKRHVVALEALFMLGFGPRLPQAVLALADAVHSKPS